MKRIIKNSNELWTRLQCPKAKDYPCYFLLQDFSKDEMQTHSEALDDAALEFVVSGLNTAMNKFTGSATN